MTARDSSTATAPERPAPKAETKPVALALQGGGAHGAFAWGILDRLLEDGRLAVEGISATSAGAMNTAVLAHGLLNGGREGARAALTDFWHAVSRAGEIYSPFRQLPWQGLFNGGKHTLDDSPQYFWADLMLRVFSPYEFNPLNMNPLRDVLARHVDFEALRKHCPIQIYLCATNVETGKVRVFSGEDISIEAVLASACLPFLFQSVEIDGQYYWDGGYVGNPAIFPLIYNCGTRDVVILHINPIVRPGVPTRAPDILNRINEISFNSSLMREMRAIAFVTSLLKDGKVAASEMKEMFIHSIRSDQAMAELGVSSKLNCNWDFLQYLRDRGREEAGRWLDATYDSIGRESSIDIRAEFL